MSTTTESLDLSTRRAISKLEHLEEINAQVKKFIDSSSEKHTEVATILAKIAVRYTEHLSDSSFGAKKKRYSIWLPITHQQARDKLGISNTDARFMIVATHKAHYDPEATHSRIIKNNDGHYSGIFTPLTETEHIASIESLRIVGGVAKNEMTFEGDDVAEIDGAGYIVNPFESPYVDQKIPRLGPDRDFIGVRLPKINDGYNVRTPYLDASSNEFVTIEHLAHVLLQEAMLQSSS